MTATEQTLIGNDNSPERVLAETLLELDHEGCDHNTCHGHPRSAYEAMARELLKRLGEDFWIVGKVEHDVNPFVRPYIRGGWVFREAGDSDPSSARLYAAQLLAAADKAEEEA